MGQSDRIEVPVRPTPERRRRPKPEIDYEYDGVFDYWSTPALVPRSLLERFHGLEGIIARPPVRRRVAGAKDPQRITEKAERHAKSFARNFGDIVASEIAAMIDEFGFKARGQVWELQRRFEVQHPDRWERFVELFRNGTIRNSSVPYNAFGYAAQNAQILYWGGWPEPQWSTCRICNHRFLPVWSSGRDVSLGVVDAYCPICIARIGYSEEADRNTEAAAAGDETLLVPLRQFADVLGYAPSGNERSHLAIAGHAPETADLLLAGMMALWPTESLIQRFGRPWTRVLLAAGLFDGGRPTARGTISVARDGHMCRSLGERTIDDFLDAHAIAHSVEPAWPPHPTLNPAGRMRADWALEDGTLVEFAGLAGDRAYDIKMMNKRRLAHDLGINLIVIAPLELAHLGRLFGGYLGGKVWATPTEPNYQTPKSLGR